MQRPQGEDGVKSRLWQPFVKCYPRVRADDCDFQHQPHPSGLPGMERPRRESVLTQVDCLAHLRGFTTLPYFSDKAWLNHILTKPGLTWAVLVTSFRF